jgi:hypothetical protein
LDCGVRSKIENENDNESDNDYRRQEAERGTVNSETNRLVSPLASEKPDEDELEDDYDWGTRNAERS